MNVWTVLWQFPDGKPFFYKTSPKGSNREVRPRKYTVEEVQKWKAMALRHLPDAKFRCLSNVDIPGVEVVPLEYPDLIAWWAKMALFAPNMPEGRNVYFDIDTLLLRKIDGIAWFKAPFACIPGMSGMERVGGKPWEDGEGKYRYPRYQTSCMVWDTDQAKPVWDEFQSIKEYALEHYASDQDFLGDKFPNLALMPRPWFMKLNTVKGSPRHDCRVVLTMMAHNDGAAEKYSWASEAWN